MINVIMFAPEFEPTKNQLAVPKIAEIVREALMEPLRQYLLLHKSIDF
jgi:hypothetical protein